MDLKQVIVNLFDTHPTVDVFYMTSDNQFFPVQANADYHASKLPKKGVATITRGISEQLKEALSASDIGLEHPEQTTALSAEQLAVKQSADNEAQSKLAEAIGGVINNGQAAVIKHIVTQEDLDANPELGENGVIVGDEIDIPGADTVNSIVVKSPLEIALETPEAERTPVQKGLITKAANAAIKNAAPAENGADGKENTNTDTNNQA